MFLHLCFTKLAGFSEPVWVKTESKHVGFLIFFFF